MGEKKYIYGGNRVLEGPAIGWLCLFDGPEGKEVLDLIVNQTFANAVRTKARPKT